MKKEIIFLMTMSHATDLCDPFLLTMRRTSEQSGVAHTQKGGVVLIFNPRYKKKVTRPFRG